VTARALERSNPQTSDLGDLDRLVVDCLNKIRGTTWRTAGWSTEQYETYLNLARRWAANWAGGVEPELVEATLFECGRANGS
jgi:hypothetical protein